MSKKNNNKNNKNNNSNDPYGYNAKWNASTDEATGTTRDQRGFFDDYNQTTGPNRGRPWMRDTNGLYNTDTRGIIGDPRDPWSRFGHPSDGFIPPGGIELCAPGWGGRWTEEMAADYLDAEDARNEAHQNAANRCRDLYGVSSVGGGAPYANGHRGPGIWEAGGIMGGHWPGTRPDYANGYAPPTRLNDRRRMNGQEPVDWVGSDGHYRPRAAPPPGWEEGVQGGSAYYRSYGSGSNSKGNPWV